MTDPSTIYVVSSGVTPRLTYTVALLFDNLLQQKSEVVEEATYPELPEQAWVINYTNQHLAGALLHIPPEGLLAENQIRQEAPPFTVMEGFPRLFPLEQLDSLGFDILSAAFYLASGYAFYQSDAKDEHGRHDEQALFTVQQNLHTYPWVHHYADYLAQKLAQATGKKLSLPKADYHLTWDIDRPWAYRHQGFLRQLKGSIGDLRHFGVSTMLERWQTLAGLKLDPFFTYPLISQYSPPAKTTCFFLINGKTPYDSFYNAQNEAYQKLIKDLQEEGFGLGLHPSYQAGMKPTLLKREKAQLEGILKQEITVSRQHFVRYQFPETFRNILDAGIKQDYSLCPIGTSGFLMGMARPFHWFDLSANQTQPLILQPTMVMDRSLQQYQGLRPEEGMDQLQLFHERTRQAGGIFTLLLHNETISNHYGWEGWQKPLLEWLANLPKA